MDVDAECEADSGVDEHAACVPKREIVDRLPRWAVVLGCVLGLTGITGFGWWVLDAAQRSDDGPSEDTSVGFRSFPPAQRPPAPRLMGTSIDGNPLDTSQYSGRVLVINVWGSWCGPCRAEAPALAVVSKDAGPDGAVFFGVDVRDNPASAKGFERGYGFPYPSFDDRSGQVLGRFNGLIPITAVPSTVFVDARGRIAARVIGRVDQTTLREEIKALLREAR